MRTTETNSVVFFTEKQYPEPKFRPVVAAWQLITPENIGNLIRVADNVGAQQVFILGDEFHLRISTVKKTAGLSFNNVQLVFISSEKFFETMDPEYQLVAIETSKQSVNLFEVSLPEKVAFILGNERNGLPEEILGKCPLHVHIPMTGQCKSMNVSHALAVALFEWQRQNLFSKQV